MAKMTKRERVMRAVNFEETDRVPLYDIIQNDAITEHYSGRPLTVENGMESVGMAIGATLDATRMVSGPQEPRTFDWGNGFVSRIERYTSWYTQRPFTDVESLAEWVKKKIQELDAQTYGPDDAQALRDMIEARQADFMKGDPERDDDPAVFVLESGVGLTEMYAVAGWDLFSMLMMMYPDLTFEWLDAGNRNQLRKVAAVADPEILPIVLTYDDIAYKGGMIISPDWLRQGWTEGLKKLVSAWHTRDTKCIFHSDGKLWDIMDDLVDAGIDGLNPLEVMADMTVKKVRERYPHLFLTGGIDVSQLLPFGTPEEVGEVCRQTIADADGRGYLMGSSTEIHWDVPLENAQAMFETAWEMAE